MDIKIAGLQKMTLLDYPGKLACIVFLPGCNFRCPFCHNSDLLPGNAEPQVSYEELMAFLRKRQGMLEGVCVTGGEPTLQPWLGELLGSIKALGYSVKLDTNGSRPEVLKALAAQGLVDYVAMDVKNSPARYSETTGASQSLLPAITESLNFLLQGTVDYELRTTVVDELHDENSVAEMGSWLASLAPGRKVKRFFLQPFADRESVLMPGLHTPAKEKLAAFTALLAPFAETVELRGTE